MTKFNDPSEMDSFYYEEDIYSICAEEEIERYREERTICGEFLLTVLKSLYGDDPFEEEAVNTALSELSAYLKVPMPLGDLNVCRKEIP